MRRLLLALLLVAGTLTRTEALDQAGSITTWADGYVSGDPAFQGWFRASYVLDAQPRPWVFIKLAVLFERDSHGDIRRDRWYDDADRDSGGGATGTVSPDLMFPPRLKVFHPQPSHRIKAAASHRAQ